MLSHLRILDLTDRIGVYAGRLLAELGAEVVRPASLEREADLAWNVGKKFVELDTGDASTLEQFLGDCDIVLRNAVDAPFTHERAASLNPRLIDVVIGAFDPQGPARDRPATDLTLMARSGLMWITGDPDRAPLRLPGEQAHALAGAQAVVAALTAVHARHAHGRGQLVTVSAFQSAVLANYREPLMWQFAGRIGKRTGNLLVRGKSGVRQIWPCSDGFVTWSFVDNPGMMRALVKVMAAEDRAGVLTEVQWDQALIADMPKETLDQWESLVAAFFLGHSKRELAQWSIRHGFGLSAIEEAADVMQSEQLRTRAMWRTVDDPRTGAVLRVPGPLFVVNEPPARRGESNE